jgi:hypothetical protein
MPGRQQSLDEMTADETRAAGDKDCPHKDISPQRQIPKNKNQISNNLQSQKSNDQNQAQIVWNLGFDLFNLFEI